MTWSTLPTIFGSSMTQSGVPSVTWRIEQKLGSREQNSAYNSLFVAVLWVVNPGWLTVYGDRLSRTDTEAASGEGAEAPWLAEIRHARAIIRPFIFGTKLDSRGNSKGLWYKDVAPSEVGSLDAIVAMRHKETLGNSGTAKNIYVKFVSYLRVRSAVTLSWD